MSMANHMGGLHSGGGGGSSGLHGLTGNPHAGQTRTSPLNGSLASDGGALDGYNGADKAAAAAAANWTKFQVL